MRVAGRFVVSAAVRVLSGAQPSVATPSRPAFVRASFRRAPAQVQPVDVSPIEHLAIANAYQRSVSFAASPFVHQNASEKTALRFKPRANPALNLAPFSRWTLRDKAAQRRLALRWAAQMPHSRAASHGSEARNHRATMMNLLTTAIYEASRH